MSQKFNATTGTEFIGAKTVLGNRSTADTVAFETVDNTSGTNGAVVSRYAGTRDPNGVVTATAGSLYQRSNGTLYVNTDGVTAWAAQGSSGGPFYPLDGSSEALDFNATSSGGADVVQLRLRDAALMERNAVGYDPVSGKAFHGVSGQNFHIRSALGDYRMPQAVVPGGVFVNDSSTNVDCSASFTFNDPSYVFPEAGNWVNVDAAGGTEGRGYFLSDSGLLKAWLRRRISGVTELGADGSLSITTTTTLALSVAGSPGAAGQVLTSNGATASWQAPSAGGSNTVSVSAIAATPAPANPGANSMLTVLLTFAGARTFQLPSAASASDGTRVCVKEAAGNAAPIAVTVSGGGNIDFGAAFNLSAVGASATFQFNVATNQWWVI